MISISIVLLVLAPALLFVPKTPRSFLLCLAVFVVAYGLITFWGLRPMGGPWDVGFVLRPFAYIGWFFVAVFALAKGIGFWRDRNE